MVSLSKFCKMHNIAKTTAYERLRANNFNTSQGLGVEAQQFLLREFAPKPVVTQAETLVPIVVPNQIEASKSEEKSAMELLCEANALIAQAMKVIARQGV